MDCIKIRKKSFSTTIPHNNLLDELVRDWPSHSFLRNNASQNTYNYLTKYVVDFCQEYFSKEIGNLKILDWGCGKGQVTYLMNQRGASITSCDIKQDRPDSAFGQEIPIIDKSIIKVDELSHPFKLPYVDEQFDVVLSFGVLEHVPDDQASMGELNRILKKGGLIFVFSLPYYLSWTQAISRGKGDHYHDRLYTKKGVRLLTENCGFQLMDYWFRQLFPKNRINYPNFRLFEKLDQFLTEGFFLKFFATNFEFVAKKK